MACLSFRVDRNIRNYEATRAWPYFGVWSASGDKMRLTIVDVELLAETCCCGAETGYFNYPFRLVETTT